MQRRASFHGNFHGQPVSSFSTVALISGYELEPLEGTKPQRIVRPVVTP